jgi:hypothetical protein
MALLGVAICAAEQLVGPWYMLQLVVAAALATALLALLMLAMSLVPAA